ncbi:sulfatase-like hydrolase/transferase [Pontiellaceae bacterium B12227]|nr:sulfatase-like hydrolase/transferase [Pontiellaceae bacterium B12227]
MILKLTNGLIIMAACALCADAALIHHYRLDETFQHEAIVDSAGSADASSTELLRGRDGMIAGSLEFSEGDNDSINLGAGNQRIPAGNFTATVWIRFSPEGFDENERILDCSDGDAFGAMTSGFNFKKQNGKLRVFAGDGVNKVATGTSASVLGAEQWYLVALRYQASSNPGTATDGSIQVTAIPFTNAMLSATGVAAVTDSASHNVGTIGTTTDLIAGVPTGVASSAGLSFDGRMDDIRIYDTALSDQELADLYNENLSVVSCLRWIFNIDGDREGWSAAGTTSDAVAGGDYVVVAAGNDPQIISPDNLGLDLTGISRVYVKAKNGSSNETAAVFFQTLEDPSFIGNSVDFTVVTNDPGYTLYEIDMSVRSNWHGTLKQLRIDLPNGESSGAEIRFDRIAVGESGNRPNVIVMMADDLGWRDVTVNGGDYYQTPNVERLAAAGMNFPNAHSANPLCSPTRAGVLTGLYPARVRFNTPNGHSDNVVLDPGVGTTANSYLPSTSAGTRTRLPNAYVTYAELMKQTGYSTAFLGKWHLGKDEYIPENQGFDFVVGGRQHSGPPGGYFAPFSADSNIPATWPDGSPVETDDHVNDILAAWAEDFIEDNRHQPFLMNMWWYDVHGPFQAKPDIRSKYVGLSGSEGRQDSPTMAAMIEVMDDGVGLVLDKLEELGLTDDTIIFFTGDNGGWMYSWIAEDLAVPTDNWPSRAGKACIWDGGSHVPFIVDWPGQVAGGTVNSNNVNNMDIYATVLDMLDLEPYDGYALDSTSLVPSLLGQAPSNGNTVFVQFPQSPPSTGTFPGVWVRQDDWKLIRFYHGGGGQDVHRYELYNIADDPGEENNLADDHPALVASLDALITQHITDSEALVPIYNPNYVPPTFEGWTPNHGVWVQDGTGGRLKMVSNSFLPALDSPDLSAEPVPAKVRVTMTSQSYGDGRIWWKFPGDTEWLIAQSVGFAVTHDNVERTFEIPINPGAPVAQIRFQPSSGYYNTQVLEVAVLDAGGEYITSVPRLDTDGDGMTDGEENIHSRDPNDPADMAFHFNADDDFEGWHTNPKNMTGFMVSNGAVQGTTTSGDPHFENHEVGFDSAPVPAVTLRMRASANAGVQLYWAPEGGGFVGNLITKQYTNNGTWQVIEFPMAGTSGWDGNIIDKLRVDPIGSEGATFEIDWIRSANGDADGDGFDDWAEIIAGTDWLDPAENKFVVDGSQIPVQVDGKAGRLYSLQWTESLKPTSWGTVESAGPLGSDQTVFFASGTPSTNGFYRVLVELP